MKCERQGGAPLPAQQGAAPVGDSQCIQGGPARRSAWASVSTTASWELGVVSGAHRSLLFLEALGSYQDPAPEWGQVSQVGSSEMLGLLWGPETDSHQPLHPNSRCGRGPSMEHGQPSHRPGARAGRWLRR